jgi:hypothetical protein
MAPPSSKDYIASDGKCYHGCLEMAFNTNRPDVNVGANTDSTPRSIYEKMAMITLCEEKIDAMEFENSDMRQNTTIHEGTMVMFNYWKYFENRAVVLDEDIFKMAYYLATACYLLANEAGEDFGLTATLAEIALFLEYWVKFGGHDELFERMLADQSETSIRRYYNNSLSKVHSTEYGLCRFLAGKIPCNCLAATKARLTPTNICFGCLEEFPKAALQKCSKCKRATYCSKECQVGDWKMGHKGNCNELATFVKVKESNNNKTKATNKTFRR